MGTIVATMSYVPQRSRRSPHEAENPLGSVVRFATVPVVRVRQPTEVSLHLPHRMHHPYIAA
jgi:hypothetical protein